jgi:hypothetical protein
MIHVGILTAAATSSFSFLLDEYPGAAAAYSLRKLRNAYTGNCIRVRRSSDGATSDIGFLNNVLDATTLLTFVGVDDGTILIWYDQSGNGNNAIQINALSQPTIVLSSVLITENSKPSIFFNQKSLNFISLINSDTNTSAYILGKANSLLTSGPIIGQDAPGGSGMFIGQREGYYQINSLLNGVASFVQSAANTANTNFCIQNAYITTVYNYFVNNTAITMPAPTTWSPSDNFFWNIGIYGNAFFTVGNISEVIIYKTNQLSNRTGINANINSFYTIF